jgi:hypothetical protein
MGVLSAVLYFFTDQPMLAMLVLAIAGLGAGAVLANVRGHRGWYQPDHPFLPVQQDQFLYRPYTPFSSMLLGRPAAPS